MYGPFGYSVATDPTSTVTRIRSSYALKVTNYTITVWHLAVKCFVVWRGCSVVRCGAVWCGVVRNQTQARKHVRTLTHAFCSCPTPPPPPPPLPPSPFQPASSRTGTTAGVAPFTNLTHYPLGIFLQDYAHIPNEGDLDVHNGRWCVTPDFPAGTYAYFMTVQADGMPAYPYIVGPQFYGSTTIGGPAGTVPLGCTNDRCSSSGAIAGAPSGEERGEVKAAHSCG